MLLISLANYFKGYKSNEKNEIYISITLQSHFSFTNL